MAEFAPPASKLASTGVPLGPLPRPAELPLDWPIGMVGLWPFGLSTLPSQFLACEGQVLDGRQYPELCARAGLAPGSSITLPDFRDYAPRGVPSGGSVGTTTAGTTPSHTHPISSDGSHVHTNVSGSNRWADDGGGVANIPSGTTFVYRIAAMNSAGAHAHGGSTGSSGSGTDNIPKSRTVYIVIRVR